MARKPIFDVLVLLGRPAAGKSEILEHLRNMEFMHPNGLVRVSKVFEDLTFS